MEYNDAIRLASGTDIYRPPSSTTENMYGNFPVDSEEPPKRTSKPKKGSKQKTVEQIYAELIKEGYVKIVRRKGKPPLVQWLK